MKGWPLWVEWESKAGPNPSRCWGVMPNAIPLPWKFSTPPISTRKCEGEVSCGFLEDIALLSLLCTSFLYRSLLPFQIQVEGQWRWNQVPWQICPLRLQGRASPARSRTSTRKEASTTSYKKNEEFNKRTEQETFLGPMWWVNYMVWTSKISQVNSFHRNRNHKNSKEARHQPHLLSWNKWFHPLSAIYWCGIAHHKSKGRKSRLRWYQDVDPASHAVFGKLAKASNNKGCERIGRNRIDEAIPDSHPLSTPGQASFQSA